MENAVSTIRILRKAINPFIIFALLFLAIFQLPEFFPSLDNSHDSGSHAAIDYWASHGFSFGKEIIQNVGPIGFLNYPGTYSGFFVLTKLILTIFLTCYFVFLLMTSTKNMSVIKKTVFLICAAVLTAGITDTMLYFLLFLLLQRLFISTKWQNLLLPTFTLSILALAKGTCFFIALSIIITSVLSHLFYRRLHTVFFITTFFCFFVLVLWFSFGQGVSNIIDFAYAMLLFSSGYNEAMTIFESNFIRNLGIITFLGSFLAIWFNGLKLNRKNADKADIVKQVLLAIVESFILFIVWKHGFVRADGHVVLFFQYAMLSTLWIIFNENLVHEKITYPISNSLIALSVSVCCMMGLNAGYNFFHQLILPTYQRIEKNFFAMFEIDKYNQNLKNELEQNIAKMQLPWTKELVKNKPISYFGIFPASIIYNKLNYIPNPATMSLASWNAWIMNKEARFFANDKLAPTYLLFDLKTIDNRLVAQDDSLAQLEILHRYVPIGSEAGNLILRRINNVKPFTIEPILNKNYKIGQYINVPKTLNPSEPIWLQVNFDRSLLSNLMALMYKPSQYSIEFLLVDGSSMKFKFNPGMAAVGFLLNPLITKNSDVLAAYLESENSMRNSFLNKVTKIRINCDVLKFSCAQTAFLQFNSINNLISENNLISTQYMNSLVSFDSVIEKSNIPKVTVAKQCEGHIDTINEAPGPLYFFVSRLLNVQGWLAKSIESKAGLPESVLLVLTDSKGKNTFIKTRPISRSDVGASFKNSILDNSGYTSTVNVSDIDGDYTLGLAYTEGNLIKICPQVKIPGTFKSDKIKNESSKSINQRVSNANQCIGSIDAINDIPASTTFLVEKQLKVQGWLAKSVEPKAELPESVLIVLTDSKGKNTFIKTSSMPRPDVGSGFKNSILNSSGYAATAAVSGIEGNYTLGLAYTEGNLIKICPQFKISGTFKSRLCCLAQLLN